jgi:MYXO-CTERM domain-containing protein
MSWETHLAAALIGVALAVALRRRDVLPRKRYGWEEAHDEDEAGEAGEAAPHEADPAGATLEERRP